MRGSFIAVAIPSLAWEYLAVGPPKVVGHCELHLITGRTRAEIGAKPRGVYRGRGYAPIAYAYLIGGSRLDAGELEKELRQNVCSIIDDYELMSIP